MGSAVSLLLFSDHRLLEGSTPEGRPARPWDGGCSLHGEPDPLKEADANPSSTPPAHASLAPLPAP